MSRVRHTPTPPKGQYAFAGRIEFDIAIDVLGVRSRRRVRVAYACSPAWEHCDPQGRLRVGSGNDAAWPAVLTRSDDMPYWSSSRELTDALLGPAEWQEIDQEIERQVRRQDCIRRRMNGHQTE